MSYAPTIYTGEQGYLDLLRDVTLHGKRRSNRTGIDTAALFGVQMRFDLRESFPLFTTKKVWWKGVAVELDWMLRGESNIEYLTKHGVGIWDEWAQASYRPEMGYEDGELGPVYGVQWRRWPKGSRPLLESSRQQYLKDFAQLRTSNQLKVIHQLRHRATDLITADKVDDAMNSADGSLAEIGWALLNIARSKTCVDQIAQIVDKLRHHRDDRRIILSSWNVGEIDKMKLPPCHYASQFLVDESDNLTCIVSLRSWDLFLGAPFNVAQYGLLTCLLAHVSGLSPKEVIFNGADAHIYVNHFDQVREQVSRSLRPLPTLVIDPGLTEIDDFTFDMARIEGYDPHPAIKGDVAV